MKLKINKKLTWISLLSFMLLFSTCSVDYDFNFADVQVDVEAKPGFIIHVGNATFKLSNLIKADPGMIEFVGSDSVVTLVYSDSSVAHFAVNEVFTMPQIPDIAPQEFVFDNIKFGNITAATKVTLRDLIDNMAAESGGTIDPDLVKTTMFFPPIPFGFPGGDYEYKSFDSIDYVTFQDGEFEITVDNHTPIIFTEIKLDLVNTFDNTVVGSITFDNLSAFTTQSRTINMADKTMRKDVVARLANIKTGGGAFSSLTDEYLSFDVKNTIDLTIKEGSVIIPEQEFNDSTQIDFTPPVADAEIKEIKLKTGVFNINFSSSISSPINLDLSIPSIKDASNLVLTRNLILDSGGQPLSIDLANSTIDLTLGGTSKNLIKVKYKATVGGTGEYVTIRMPMKATISGNIANLDFDYVKGYFGTIEPYLIPEDEFELLNSSFEGLTGEIKLTNPSLRLEIDNSFGVGANIALNIKGVKGAESVTLHFDQNPLQVSAATALYQSKKTSITLDNNFTNNTISDMMGLLPEKVIYSGSASVANIPGSDNFVTSTSAINVGIFANIPFEFNAKDVAYTDTLNFDSLTMDMVGKAKLIIKTKNYMPFQVGARLLLYNSAKDVVLESIVVKNSAGGNLLFAAASETAGVTTPTESTTEIELSEAAIKALANADKIILQGVLNTYNSSSGAGVLLKANAKMEIDLTIATQLKLDSDNL